MVAQPRRRARARNRTLVAAYDRAHDRGARRGQYQHRRSASSATARSPRLGSAPTPARRRRGRRSNATLDELLEPGRRVAGRTSTSSSWPASCPPSPTRSWSWRAATRHSRCWSPTQTTIPIEIRVDNPEAVGDDRLVNAYAALRLHGAPAIVVDLGTATTFDVVDADGAFIGGAIAAGAGLGIEALARGTAQLPRVPLVMPAHAIGRDTVARCRAARSSATAGLVHVLVRAITAELPAGGAAAEGHPDRRPVERGLGAGNPGRRRHRPAS